MIPTQHQCQIWTFGIGNKQKTLTAIYYGRHFTTTLVKLILVTNRITLVPEAKEQEKKVGLYEIDVSMPRYLVCFIADLWKQIVIVLGWVPIFQFFSFRVILRGPFLKFMTCF